MKFKLFNNILLDPQVMGAAGGMPPVQVASPLPPNTQVQPAPLGNENTPANPSPEQSNETERSSPETIIAQAPVEAGTENLMDAFRAAADKGYTNNPPTPKVAAEPEGVSKTAEQQDKSKLPEAAKETPPPQTTPLPKITLDSGKPKARDYSDLPPEAQDMFRNMSNKAYDTLKPIYLEHKKGMEVLKAKDLEIETLKKAAPASNSLPANYLEHEAAYTLTPDFQKAEAQAQQLTTEYNHWSTQLEKAKRGEKWVPLVTNARGEIVQGAEQPFHPRAEEIIRERMMEARQLYNSNEQFIGNMAATHKVKVQQGVAQLKQIEDEFFPFYKDYQNSPDKSIIEQSIKGLPEAFQNSPMAILLGKAYATCVRLHTSLQEATQGNPAQIAASVAEDQKKAGPTGASINGAPAATPKADEDLMGKFAQLTGKTF